MGWDGEPRFPKPLLWGEQMTPAAQAAITNNNPAHAACQINPINLPKPCPKGGAL